MTAEKQQNEPSRKRRTLLLLCIVLLLCGIGAEGFLLIRRAENSIRIFQRDPAAELLEAVRSGDFHTASLIRLTDYPEGIVPDTLTQKLTEYAQSVRNAYFAGQTDAENAKAQTDALIQLDIPALTAEIEPIYEDIRMREAWLAMIRKADAYYEAGNYAAALEQYGKIPENDAELMNLTADNTALCTELYLAQTMSETNTALQEQDYNAAVSRLNDALRILKDNEQLRQMLNDTQEQQMRHQYVQACQKARNCFDSGQYTDAFDALSLPDEESSSCSGMIADTQKSYQDAYFRILPVRMRSLLESGQTEQAEQLLHDAETLFPDAPETAALTEQYQQALPKELIAFGEPELNDFTQTDLELTGYNGKTYRSDSGNLYCSYEGTLSGRQSSSAVFHISGGYQRLTLTALPLDSFDEDTTVLLDITADGSVLETYAVSRKPGVLHIDLDITGAEEICLRVKPAEKDGDLRNAGVIIADAVVSIGS